VPPEVPATPRPDGGAIAPGTVAAAAPGARLPVGQPDAPEPELRAYVVPPELPATPDADGSTIEAIAPGAVAAAAPGVALPIRQPEVPASEPAAGPQQGAMPVPRLRPEPPAALASLPPVPALRPASLQDAPAEVALVTPELPAPADQAAAPLDEAPAPQIQARLIAFAPGSADLAAAIEPELTSVLADAERVGLVIDIIGEAKDPDLALERARAVALALIKLGAGTERLRIGADPEPTGDRAWIILADPL
jgi:hypothetical protein